MKSKIIYILNLPASWFHWDSFNITVQEILYYKVCSVESQRGAVQEGFRGPTSSSYIPLDVPGTLLWSSQGGDKAVDRRLHPLKGWWSGLLAPLSHLADGNRTSDLAHRTWREPLLLPWLTKGPLSNEAQSTSFITGFYRTIPPVSLVYVHQTVENVESE